MFFYHDCTKIEFLESELQIHRNTAIKYLDELVHLNILSKHRIGKENYYLNDALFGLLQSVGGYSETPSKYPDHE